MVDSGRQHEQVARFDSDADPAVVAIPDVKVARAGHDESNLFVRVQVFGVKDLQLYHTIIRCQKVKQERAWHTTFLPSLRNLEVCRVRSR